MNKRQAKKAFKKKYGCTPNQAKYALIHFFDRDNLARMSKAFGDAVSEFLEQFKEGIEGLPDALQYFLESAKKGGWL